LKSKEKAKKTALIYWPFSVFREVHLKKDVGSISQFFREKGYETTLIVGEFLPAGINGVNIYETGNPHSKIMNPLSQANEFIKVLKKLIRLSPDIIITYNRNPFFPLVAALYKFTNIFKFTKRCKTKFIIKMDSDGNFRFTNFPSHFLDNSYFHGVLNISAIVMLKMNYFFSDYISIESECGLEKVKKTLRKAKKLVVVPNGCALSYFEDDQAVSKKEDVILAVSRVARQKSLETLIEAFALIGPNFPEWSVKMVGDIEDQLYYEELVKLIEKLGLHNSVNFEGTVSQEKLLEFYSRSSIFCLSSNWESDGISRREAIAAGLPVITTEAGCGRSLEKYGSIVVPIGDSTALAAGLARLMSDANLRKEISASQKAAVVSWDDVVEKYINL
jgi:glycosyltransferase involved in cell wall biosynthesis